MTDILDTSGQKCSAAHFPGVQGTVLTKRIQLIASNAATPISISQRNFGIASVFLKRLIHYGLNLQQILSRYIQTSYRHIRHHTRATYPGAQPQISACHNQNRSRCKGRALPLGFWLFQFSCSCHFLSSFRLTHRTTQNTCTHQYMFCHVQTICSTLFTIITFVLPVVITEQLQTPPVFSTSFQKSLVSRLLFQSAAV